MPITGEIQSLYKDKDKTKLIFPTTKVKAISDDDGVGLNVLLEHMVYSDPEDMEIAATPINADVLGGFPASDYATKTYVSNKIAEVQLEGSDVDLSGYATKDDLNGLTAEDVGARPDTWLPTIAEIGAAPAGYGLGGWAELGGWAGIDGLTANGWYRFDSINVTINNVGVVSALVRVDWYYGSYGTQTLYAVNSGSGSNEIPVLKRTCGYAGWQPWECVNPPMEVGKEYRTTKRYVNKPVYTMAINCGAMPNNTLKEVAYSVPSGSVQNVLSVRGTNSQGDALPYVSSQSTYTLCATPKYVELTTNRDKSAYVAVAIIEYVKN